MYYKLKNVVEKSVVYFLLAALSIASLFVLTPISAQGTAEFIAKDYETALTVDWTGDEPIVTWNNPTTINSSSVAVDLDVDVQLNNAGYAGNNVNVYLYAYSNDKGILSSSIYYSQVETVTFADETEVLNFTYNDMLLYHEGDIRFGIDMFVDVPGTPSADDPYFSTHEFSGTSNEVRVNYNPTVVYRFYSEVYGGHFYTTSKSERDNVMQNDPNWSYEGERFKVSPLKTSTTCADQRATPVYRFWSDTYRRHFYTVSPAEANNVQANPEWNIYNGIVFCAYAKEYDTEYPEAFSQVFRFWNDTNGGHFYTDSVSEKNNLQNNDPNWRYERVAFAAKDSV